MARQHTLVFWAPVPVWEYYRTDLQHCRFNSRYLNAPQSEALQVGAGGLQREAAMRPD